MTVDNLPADSIEPNPIIDPQITSQAETNAGVARATGVLALGNVGSRILGLVREIVIANLFGASAAVEAFNVAILVPKNVYDLLIGGHVNGAIIPVLSEIVEVKGKDELWRLVSILLSMVTIVLALLVLLLELGAPLVVSVIGAGFDEYTTNLAINLLRITSPALIFMGLFAIISGALYALKVFLWPAFATMMFNGAIVVIALLFSPAPRFVLAASADAIHTLPVWTSARPGSGIVVVAVGWVIGSIAYLLLQLPGLRDAKLRFTLIWRNPALRTIAMLYVPVMFSLILDTLVVRLFSYNLASRSEIVGAIGIMNWGTTLIQFPQGLVATAISIAILPTLSRQAALINQSETAHETLSDENKVAFKETLGIGVRLALALIIPAAVGLYVLATPIIVLIFQHGAFNADATFATTIVLRLYLFGLPFAAIDLLLVYAFYARQDTLTPAVVGFGSLTCYMLVAIALFPRYGLYSLMIADSVKHVVHTLTSAYLLNRRVNGLGDRRLWLTLTKTLFAAIIMGGVAYVSLNNLDSVFDGGGLLNELLLVVACGGLSGLAFVVVASILKVEEWRWITNLVLSRLRR
ncbi:MAG: murein biosynthesis integral membrane protein MurJ [Aggregatilineales bacterium]